MVAMSNNMQHNPSSDTASMSKSNNVEIKDDTTTIIIPDQTDYKVEFKENDLDYPKNWSSFKKWTICFAIILINIVTGLTMTVYASIGDTIKRDTNASQLEYISGMTTFMLSVAFLPLILSPISEQFGRRKIYVITTTLHALLFLPQIFVRNIAVIVVLRLLQGGCSSVGNTLVGGSIADIFDASDRGLPMAVFGLFAIGTQGVGPSWAGYAQINLDGYHGYGGWQWAFCITFIINCVSAIVNIFMLKETRANIILQKRAESLRKQTGQPYYVPGETNTRVDWSNKIKHDFSRAVRILIEPIAFAISLWLSFLWGVLYLILAAIPAVFESVYSFNSGQSHLILISMTIGAIIGFISNFHQQSIYQKRALRSVNKKCSPEVRLYWSCAGGLFFSIGCIMFAWTTKESIHWIVPAIALVILTWGIFIVYTAVFNYLSDCYETYASSAQAATSSFRNFLGAIFPLFSMRMYENMTPPWASTLIGILGFILASIPFLLIKYGSTIRSRSKITSQLASNEQNKNVSNISKHQNVPILNKA